MMMKYVMYTIWKIMENLSSGTNFLLRLNYNLTKDVVPGIVKKFLNVLTKKGTSFIKIDSM